MRVLRTSFTGGEISPWLYGQLPHPKHQTGIKTGLNIICMPYGPAQNRSGFKMIREVKDSSKKVRLIPYIYNNEQAYVLEVGNQYVRFHTEGQTIMTGESPYDITSPFLEADLFDIKYTDPESDVMTLTHRSHAPQELKRTAGDPITFAMTPITFGPGISTPQDVVANATGTGITIHTYVVTALDQDGLEESIASSEVSCSNDLTRAGHSNIISWTAVDGASRMHVYKYENGMPGFIGQTQGTEFTDNNINADTLQAPPQHQDHLLSSTGNYPGAVTYFEQRRIFAGTNNEPQSVVMTRSATESNLSRSVPIQNDDAIKIPVKGTGSIEHLVSAADLIVLTSMSLSKITSRDSDFITPANVWPRKLDGSAGASPLRPIVARDTVLFGESTGSHIAEMFCGENVPYLTRDISVLANHLFDDYQIVDWAFMRTPYPIVWAVRNDGMLLSLTYLPDRAAQDQGVLAWTHHTTEGLFESVAVIPENDGRERLYAVIQRTINGQVKRFVERMETRNFSTIEDAFFVDCGLTYQGVAVTTVTGLDHLEGATVAVVADGMVQPGMTVTSGQITLTQAATKVHVGLPYVADINTLALALQKEAWGQGQHKNISRVGLLVHETVGIKAGPDEDQLSACDMTAPDHYGDPHTPVSGEITIDTETTWTHDASVFIRQDQPMPVTVLSLVLEVH